MTTTSEPLSVSKQLTPEETSRLQECEQKIEAGQKTFIEVGQALLEIRDGRLYRSTCGNFDEYCTNRWGWKRAHIYRLMEAARIVEKLSPMGDNIPANERVARELATAPAEQRQEVWDKAVEVASTKGKPTPQVIDVQVAVSQVVEQPLTEASTKRLEESGSWKERDRLRATNNWLERLEETICHDPLFASLEPGQKLEAGEIAMRAAKKAGRKVSSGDLLRAAKVVARPSDEKDDDPPRVRAADEESDSTPSWYQKFLQRQTKAPVDGALDFAAIAIRALDDISDKDPDCTKALKLVRCRLEELAGGHSKKDNASKALQQLHFWWGKANIGDRECFWETVFVAGDTIMRAPKR